MAARSRFRRISGPLSFLPDDPQLGDQIYGEQDGELRLGSQTGGTQPTVDETLSPLFQKGPWYCLCDAFNISIPSGNGAGTSIREAVGTTVSDVLEGKCGLRVSKLVGVASAVTHNGDGSVSVVIMDPTGSIHGYLHEDLIEEYGPDLMAGFAIALSKVSILVSGPGVQRWLNITPNNVITFFAKSSLPDAATSNSSSRVITNRGGRWTGASQEHKEDDEQEMEQVRTRCRGGGSEVVPNASMERSGGGASSAATTTTGEVMGGGTGAAMTSAIQFGWESEERRAEAISVLSSRPVATTTSTRRGPWHEHQEEKEEEEGDEQVAQHHQEREDVVVEPERQGTAWEPEEAVRRDIWSMDIEDEDDDAGGDFYLDDNRPPSAGAAAAAVPSSVFRPSSSSTSSTVVGAAARMGAQETRTAAAAAADWVIGQDSVLRTGAATAVEEEGAVGSGADSGLLRPSHSSHRVSRSDCDTWETYDADDDYYMDPRPGAAGDVPLLHDHTDVVMMEGRHHQQPGTEGVSRFFGGGGSDGQQVEANKVGTVVGMQVVAEEEEEDVLGGILEEDEMLW